MNDDRPKKRWRIVRVGVHGLTLLIIAAFLCSIWLPQTLVIDHTNAVGNQRIIFLQLHGGRINAEQSPMLPPTGTKGFILQRIGANISGMRDPWWALPSFQYFPTPSTPGSPPGIPAWFIELPLVYPVLLLVLISYLIIRRRRPYDPGHCSQCGYNLADIHPGTCPECGADHA